MSYVDQQYVIMMLTG